jgi:mono/diheme cytochrome c family protein
MKRIACALGIVALAIGGGLFAMMGTLAAAAPQRGADLYKVNCAACHGLDGAGSGLMTPQLRHVPPDLTQLSKRNGGMFPRVHVRRVVEGRDVPSHGERDMPVWGDAFTRTDPESRESSDARINAVLDYLDSIQARSSH